MVIKKPVKQEKQSVYSSDITQPTIQIQHMTWWWWRWYTIHSTQYTVSSGGGGSVSSQGGDVIQMMFEIYSVASSDVREPIEAERVLTDATSRVNGMERRDLGFNLQVSTYVSNRALERETLRGILTHTSTQLCVI